jgi:hypothetical protein
MVEANFSDSNLARIRRIFLPPAETIIPSLPTFSSVMGLFIIALILPFKAKVEDPTDNDKIRAIMNKPITLEKVGNEGIMVSAGGKKILRMRAKFESEKLASTIKFTADPA